jgi:homoserine kinase
MISVKVPATSANIGPGFDCIGIALNLYNTISAGECDEGLKIDIQDESRHFLPRDKRNLVYRAMNAVFSEAGYYPRGIHIIQKNEIPVTRGLGSSSASIVGGMIAANLICQAKMSKDDIISFAANFEGHPDNTTPAITGGMAIAVINGDKTHYQKIEISPDKLKFAVFIPDFILKTKKARSILPPVVPREDAIFNTARASLLTAAMITGNYENLITALDDRLHQQYRKRFIKGIDKIFDIAIQSKALGSYISGAGPAVISVILSSQKEEFLCAAKEYLLHEDMKWDLMMLEPDNFGARIID